MRRTAFAVATAFALGAFSHAAYAAKPPKLDDALVHLRYALNALKRAEVNDKASAHRDQAVQLTEKALEEVNRGIKAGTGE
ncbi:MAG: hypothetical protein JXB05_13035 [Myxococcaceae bacterium]|nr:hypothetical protein [Myxococcaceae bacterium]